MTDFDSRYFNRKYDNIPLVTTLPSSGWTAQTVFSPTSGTGSSQATNLSNYWVSGSGYFSNGTYISSGGSIAVGSGGSIINATFGVYQGGTLTNGIAIDGASLAAVGASGIGTIISATALYNADVVAMGSGILSNAVVGSSGALFAGAGYQANGNITYDSAVSAAGTAFNPIVGSRGYALVGGGETGFVVKGYSLTRPGGLISGGTFNPGSLYGVGNGGTALEGYVGGTQGVFKGGLSTQQLFIGSSAAQFVVSSGLSTQATAISGALLEASGGTINGAVLSGGTALIQGGTYISWLNKNYEPVSSNYAVGYSSDTQVSSGSTEIIAKDGIASHSTVLPGGTGIVSSGGIDINPYISGGTEIVSNGGTLIGGSYTLDITSTFASSVSGGSTSFLSASDGSNSSSSSSNGSNSSSSSSSYNSTFSFISGGTTVYYTVSGGSTSYGTRNTQFSGSGSGALVNAGGAITISSGGYIFSGGAYDNGNIQLSAGALGSSLSAYNSGTVQILSGGTGTHIIASSGGTAQILSGGTGTNVIASSGGTAQILSGGTGTNVIASSGGSVDVSSGGSAGNLIVSGGGSANISAGGIIFNGGTLMAPGSSMVLSSGATADYLVASQGTVSANSGATLGGLYAANSNGTGILTQSGASANTAIAGYDPNNSAASSGTIIISNGGAASNMGAFAGGTAILGSGGTASQFAISGGTATLLAGAAIVSGAVAMVSSGYGQGGLLSVDSGNSITSVNVGSGGAANINSGASIGTLFLSSGNATIGSGALVSQLTVMSGASGLFMSGASVLHADVSSGGWVSGAEISNNNEMVIASSGTALKTLVTYRSGADISNDAYTMISSGGQVSGATIAGASGSALYGGLLTIESGATLLNTSIGYNGRLRIKGQPYSENWTTVVSNGLVTVTEGGTTDSSGKIISGNTWVMQLDGSYLGQGRTNTLKDSSQGGFIIVDDGQGNSVLIYDKCFLVGSMIRTPKGEKAVERLRKGELISVYLDGREETREITSIIQRRARVHVSQPEDLAGWSVLITKDAFAPGLPNKDLSVTPEHCFYFDGRFVPARMLINGASIRYDHDLSEYDYYHIKTEPHSVIWANDVLSESWLDTDVQDHLELDETNALRLVEEKERLNWDQNAAAPLEVGQDFVKPLYDRFAKRAAVLGLAPPPSPADSPAEKGTTMDPAPYLQLENGEKIQPQRHEAGRYLFTLPVQAKRVTLHSRRFRPSEAVGPYLDDRRILGMLVGQVALWTGGQESLITRHLTDQGLKGWDVIEAGPHRWTNGAAELPLHDDGHATTIGRQLLSIEVQAGGPYRLDTNPGGKEG